MLHYLNNFVSVGWSVLSLSKYSCLNSVFEASLLEFLTNLPLFGVYR